MRSDVAVSVFLPSDFPVQHIVVHAGENASAATLTVRLLPEMPAGVESPDMKGPPGLMFDVRIQSGGGDLAIERVIVHFSVSQKWVDATCPPPSCMVGVLHWTGQEWETLRAERREARADGTVAFVTVTRSLSPFVVAQVDAPASGGFPAVDGDGGEPLSFDAPLPTAGLVWPALFLLGGLLLVVAMLLIRQMRNKPVAQEEPLPLPPPVMEPPRAREKPVAAPAEGEASLLVLVDPPVAPELQGPEGPASNG